MTAHDPLEVWDWSEAEWCRQNGVRRHPRGTSYHAETRGGHGHPLPVSLHRVGAGWQLRLGPVVHGTLPELRAALAALLALTSVDSYTIAPR